MPMPQAVKHVDDMTPAERHEFRSSQVAALVVMAQHGEHAEVARVLGGSCMTSIGETLMVAIEALEALVSAGALDGPTG